MGSRPPDFNRLFVDGATREFGHFRAGCVVTVRVTQGVELTLPSGRLVAAEPWTPFADGAARYAFTERVAPGSYPVQLIMADFHDPDNPQGNTTFSEVAAARVLVRDEAMAWWRLGLQPGQDDSRLAEDEFYGYPVDGGTGSFGSVEVFDLLTAEDDRFDLLEPMLDDYDPDGEAGVFTDEATGLNLVGFPSGGGDGRYATWIGYTAEGEVACFVTDFRTLTHHDDEGEEDEGEESGQACVTAPAPVYRLRGPASLASGSEMRAGQTLSRRQTLTSPRGEFVLVYQDDGNLALYPYDGSYAVWASDTYDASVGECVLQEDGNLVVYNREGRAVWASGTYGRPVSRLAVLDRGHLTLEDPDGRVLWSTVPGAIPPPGPVPAVPRESLRTAAAPTTPAARARKAVAPRSSVRATAARPARPKRPGLPAEDPRLE